MFGRSGAKIQEPTKMLGVKSPVELTRESKPESEAGLDLTEIPRATDVQLRRLPSLPEDRHERPAPNPAPRGQHEGHVLVGEGIKIVGEIRDCRKIEIYGEVEGDLEAEELIVHDKGLLKGNVKTDRAQVHGSIDGDISVAHLLDVKSKGSVAGKTRYGQLSIETGGRIVGTLEECPADDDGRAVSGAPSGIVEPSTFKASAAG